VDLLLGFVRYLLLLFFTAKTKESEEKTKKGKGKKQWFRGEIGGCMKCCGGLEKCEDFCVDNADFSLV